MPDALGHLSWEPPFTFLGLTGEDASFVSASAVVLPIPYEATTSYGSGTARGPRAILDASRYVELYDRELDGDPSSVGVSTLPGLALTREGPAAAMAELERAYGDVLDASGHRFVVSLGGEHSISAPLIRAWAERTESRISVLQFDAHADLRDQYEGSPWSHASAMARVLDVADVVAVGLRGVSAEEVAVQRAHDGVVGIWAEDMAGDDRWMEDALEALGPDVYVTFDVDYFDPSLVPSTGTPEPGGADWYGTLRFLRRVFRERRVLACDVVELAPVPGVHAPEFLVAKLVYKMLGYRFEGRSEGR